jgi:hypothetical protein
MLAVLVCIVAGTLTTATAAADETENKDLQTAQVNYGRGYGGAGLGYAGGTFYIQFSLGI